MHAGRPAATRMLSLLYALSGALCLAGAARPMDARTPVTLLWVLGAVGLGTGTAVWLAGRRVGPAAQHVLAAGMAVLIGLLAWRSATAVGIVGLGPVLIALGTYAAWFFRLGPARAHVLLVVAAATAGAVAARPGGFASAWVPVVVATLVLTEVLARLAASLRSAATTDPLTGVANRRAWELEAERNLAHASRTGEPLTVAILDLDAFKEVNDTEGHGAGDALLRDLAHRWSGQLRRADLLGRYGGDEFVLCLPGTDTAGATEILERLDASHDFGWSVGVAGARPGDTLGSVLARADADLYRHKRSHR
ncbi:GGDEF domain-containing protein [Geodermatophilus sp. SYSU D00691]